MKRFFQLMTLVIFCVSCSGRLEVKETASDLQYDSLATCWDEAVPLGNAVLGELVWQRGDSLRFSLDHTDLWDLRPTEGMDDCKELNFKWIQERVAEGDVASIQEKIDMPYGKKAAPSKIPCAALEFPTESFGNATSVRLFLRNALCRVEWENGISLETFVNASKPVGWFVFRGIKDKDFCPTLKTPNYFNPTNPGEGAHSDIDLMKLGYPQGEVIREGDKIVYHQQGYGDFSYDVVVEWKRSGNTLYGVWSVNTSLNEESAEEEASLALQRGVQADYKTHIGYWNGFWQASSVSVPDSVLQRQYDNEMYKLGSASRENSRPISLQAVWTADDGMLPPWKGDFHNDLNTQLSYWPVYIGNHLSEGMAYLNTMWDQQEAFKEYTRRFFGTDGIIVPGVTTLDGRAMGGWAQYSMSPTVGAWISQHFYLHWKYSADDEFLSDRAYPFMEQAAIALEQLTVMDETGHRTLPLSTSPEIYNNSLEAWFRTITNYDLALIRFTFGSASEMATALGKEEEAAHWTKCLSEMPEFDLENDALTFAKGFPYNESHRHFSNAMALFPLGLIDWCDGEEAQKIIRATIKCLDDMGPAWWCGYSYSWLGNLKARAMDGEGAAEALRIFAECFCLPNTFHANGDQTRSGKSEFTYRPFTLEGNFAFASGIQQMLMQGHTGTIRVFPAIPTSWQDVSFEQLRARGAFLVSAKMSKGQVEYIRVYSEKGGKLSLLIPGEDTPREYDTQAGETVYWKAGE